MRIDESEVAIQRRLNKRFGIYAMDDLYYDRPLDQYISFLFSDDPATSTRIRPPFYKFVWKGKKGGLVKTAESPLFGGLDEFFSANARILDIGSGGGRAVREINESFNEKGLKAFGLDFRYALKQRNPQETTYVAGDWVSLPFTSDSFDRLLSYETFPADPRSGIGPWRGFPLEDYVKVFREITRVAREGSIWRGTFGTDFSYTRGRTQLTSAEGMSQLMANLGWEVYVSPHFTGFQPGYEHSQFGGNGPGTFAAQLKRK